MMWVSFIDKLRCTIFACPIVLDTIRRQHTTIGKSSIYSYNKRIESAHIDLSIYSIAKKEIFIKIIFF